MMSIGELWMKSFEVLLKPETPYVRPTAPQGRVLDQADHFRDLEPRAFRTWTFSRSQEPTLSQVEHRPTRFTENGLRHFDADQRRVTKPVASHDLTSMLL